MMIATKAVITVHVSPAFLLLVLLPMHLEIQSNSVTKESTVNYNDAAVVNNEAQSIPGNGTNIINAIHMLWRCVDISNLSQLALRVSAAIDSKIEGSITSERKAGSLQARSFARSASIITSVENGNGDEFWIERGTIVTVGATLGKGPVTRVVNYKYRVLAVYEKSYNKWFMTEKKKKWMPNMEKEEIQISGQDVGGRGWRVCRCVARQQGSPAQ